ncbi:hypothetical protein BDQ12DRAFT_667120 [Crucibulum laeve]|uniref:BTB domain-containing protein n=1 Tax=Crucibulum laeve TaxID=68775 RepID=A0A5C3LXA0_9AGAR|nr:hypothetical protein BDQ12DRAFT_667120 [Crucibulum laeve]
MANIIRIARNFNAADADVIIQSCDGVQFHIHKKYLEANTGAFPPAEFNANGEVVNLTENAITLNLLFQFIYPKRHPALDSEKFDVLAPLAEAAEKYEVMDRVALFVIRYPLDTTVALLPPRFVVPWVIVLPSRNIKKIRYYQLWLNSLLAAFRYQTMLTTVDRPRLFAAPAALAALAAPAAPADRCSCPLGPNWTPILEELAKGVQSLTQIETVFQGRTVTPASCTPCHGNVIRWKSYVETEVGRIPQFSTLL